MPLSKILLSAAALSAGCLALLMTAGILRAEDEPAPAAKASVDAAALARQLLEDTRPAKTSAKAGMPEPSQPSAADGRQNLPARNDLNCLERSVGCLP
jgi:hypothetical protein